METLWFCLVAIMIAGYVVLDGFDIGAGIVHLLVARSQGRKPDEAPSPVRGLPYGSPGRGGS